MKNPYESTNEGETECRGCGEPADGAMRIQGTYFDTPLCGDCKDDLTTICPGCEQRIWQARGYRIYSTASLYCERCAKQHPAVAESVEADARADERDSFNEARR
jgi:hypothetical protein